MEHVKVQSSKQSRNYSVPHARGRFVFTRPHPYCYSLLSAKRVRVSGTARREGRFKQYVPSTDADRRYFAGQRKHLVVRAKS